MTERQQVKTLEVKIKIVELKQQHGQWLDVDLNALKSQLAELSGNK